MTYDSVILEKLIAGLPLLFERFDTSDGGWVSVLTPESITRYSFKEERQLCHFRDLTQVRIGKSVPPPEDKLPTDSMIFGFRVGPAYSYCFVEDSIPKIIKLGTIVYLEIPLDMPAAIVHPLSDINHHTDQIQRTVVKWLVETLYQL